jgi:hypothetical protein
MIGTASLIEGSIDSIGALPVRTHVAVKIRSAAGTPRSSIIRFQA